MRLAWRNLLREKTRFAVTAIGIAFAVFLMIFEGSLLAGFLRASSKVVDATDAHLWISARGVPCFDFPSPVPSRFRDMSLGMAGVERVEKLAVGFPIWKRPDGSHQNVLLVGSDDAVAGLPRPRLERVGAEAPEAAVVDVSSFALLGLDALPARVEIDKRRALVTHSVTGFGSFLGSPYVFTTYEDARRYLGLDPDETTYLLVWLELGARPTDVRRELARRLPEVDVWTREQFSTRSRAYWILQTGAGGAILIAALLGFLVGVVIVSQTIYATTMEHLEEFATLRAMGARATTLVRVVLIQALVGSLAGYVLGVVVSVPVLSALRSSISWVHTPWWMPILMLAASLGMGSLASVVSVRKVLAVEPARVFRA